MWENFFSAVALLLVFEGILPFVCPDCWRALVRYVTNAEHQTLRIIGFLTMMSGVSLLYLVHRVIF